MYGDTWQVRWKEFLSDSYIYGSKIEFNEDGSVSYKNRLMPPGTVIHTWYSMTNFQGNRIEPSLPLIDGERAYSIAANIDYHNSESEALMLRIIFFDRYDVQAQSIIVRDKKAFFKPSIRTYSYRIELINGGNADFTFKSLVIKEVSEEEFDAEQERIERLKEDSNKSKKKRRKNKKSK
ncbi:accessory Sec system protein Asp3 [Agathobacter rectalis]|jgi:accessory secretory protein Asp3|uniref:Accessory Sec system protein Asp3 n=1 Tax=Agathobacter rectalis TaxID=39491 RepID=A0A413ZYT7_9FIRM|nr:accessory Sec system protein Asp3 [Agathobacter rectalis]RHC38213.1 accessory Sec system protein Asp3 [Agathobacter rectalis]